MARGRMLNRTVATSTKVARYGQAEGPFALVFHHRLIAFLDKNGNCRRDHYWLKSQVMPRVPEVTPDMCEKYAAALVRHELAVAYEIDGMPYLHFPGFRGEQVGLRHSREAAEVPVPEGFDEESGALTESFRKTSGIDPEGIRRLAG